MDDLTKLFAGGSFWFLAASLCVAQRANDANLKSLYAGHRWFELRDGVRQDGTSAFYQGAVACAFNDVRRCETELRDVFKHAPRSDDAVEAHRILASAYFTHGRYRKALAQVDAILALRPTDSDALGGRPVIAVVAKASDQKITGRHTMVKLQDDGLQFSIHGVRVTYWFDTGAELSILSESEAKRFGLPIQSASVQVGDVNGTQVQARIATADELTIGSLRVRHVASLVFPDNQPPFDQLAHGSRGLIGLPVLLAFKTFTWGMEKTFEIGPASPLKSVPHANLCFDGNHPLVQVAYDKRPLVFTLDTGATNTDLLPAVCFGLPRTDS